MDIAISLTHIEILSCIPSVQSVPFYFSGKFPVSQLLKYKLRSINCLQRITISAPFIYRILEAVMFNAPPRTTRMRAAPISGAPSEVVSPREPATSAFDGKREGAIARRGRALQRRKVPKSQIAAQSRHLCHSRGSAPARQARLLAARRFRLAIARLCYWLAAVNIRTSFPAACPFHAW